MDDDAHAQSILLRLFANYLDLCRTQGQHVAFHVDATGYWLTCPNGTFHAQSLHGLVLDLAGLSQSDRPVEPPTGPDMDTLNAIGIVR